MDLRHIPSLRRNEIISDMFARLRFMDRRGSGIDRILRSYSEFDNKPEFYSEADYFLVTLPNRSVASLTQDVVTSDRNVASTGRNVASSDINVVTTDRNVASAKSTYLEKEKELVDFIERIEQNSTWRKTTKEHTIAMFKKFRYDYTFNRSNITDVFDVGDAGATLILRKLKEAKLVISPRYGCYQFVRR